MMLGQYDSNKDVISFFDAEMLQLDTDGKILSVIVNGQEFNEEKLKDFLKDGYCWFYLHKAGVPSKLELKEMTKRMKEIILKNEN